MFREEHVAAAFQNLSGKFYAVSAQILPAWMSTWSAEISLAPNDASDYIKTLGQLSLLGSVVQQVATIAKAESGSKIEVTHLERMLPQIF
nr:hypothetical protein [Tanacetum cinerariifolium]